MAMAERGSLSQSDRKWVCRKGFDLINAARVAAGKEPIEDYFLPRTEEHLRRIAKANKVRLPPLVPRRA